MKRCCGLVMLLAAALHAEEPKEPAWIGIAKDSPDRKRLETEIGWIENQPPDYPAGKRVDSVAAVRGPALTKLLPKWRFYHLVWSMYEKKGFEGKAHLAWGLNHTLALSGKTEVRLEQSDGQAWIGVLDAGGVTVADEKGAKLLWDAWCEAHDKRWKDYAMKRESDTVWRLGIRSYDQCVESTKTKRVVVKQTHHTRVVIDPKTKRVIEWKMLVETSDRRELPVK